MNENDYMCYFLKKEMLKKSISLDNNSKYYSFTNRIEICGSEESEQLIALLHESIHWFLSNSSLSDLYQYYANLFNFLKYFYHKRKCIILIKDPIFNNLKDINEGAEYIIAHNDDFQKECAKDPYLVKYCRFCIDIFEIYLELQNANQVINEGLATFYSLNAKPNSPIFSYKTIPNIFNLANQNHISYDKIYKQQEKIKYNIRHCDQDNNMYKVCYNIATIISTLYTINSFDYFTNVLLQVILSDFNIFEYNLLDYNQQERSKLIQDKYSYDTMYSNLLCNAKEIISILLYEGKNALTSKKLFQIVTNHKEPINKVMNYIPHNIFDLHIYNHPKIRNEIEQLLQKKVTENEIRLAYAFSIEQRIGRDSYTFFEENRFTKNTFYDILDFIHEYCAGYEYPKIITNEEKYVENNFISTYYTMKNIIRWAEGGKYE